MHKVRILYPSDDEFWDVREKDPDSMVSGADLDEQYRKLSANPTLKFEEDWIFPIAEGVCLDYAKGMWSDGAFFDDDDIPVTWYPAEPAWHVDDAEAWKRWMDFLDGDPNASRVLLTVAKSRARAAMTRIGGSRRFSEPDPASQSDRERISRAPG